MAKKPAGKPKKQNPIRHAAEVVESRLLEGAERATETTSAETNLALAALAAIEGPREPKAKAEAKRDDGKRKSARSRKR